MRKCTFMKKELYKICDELENCKKRKICFCNEIVCTRKILNEYVNSDLDKVLKLKAELLIHEDEKRYKTFDGNNLTGLSIIVTLLLSCFTEQYLVILLLFAALGILFLANYCDIVNVTYETPRNRWSYYICVVLEEMEQEIKNQNNLGRDIQKME